jgi:hypothetical protein
MVSNKDDFFAYPRPAIMYHVSNAGAVLCFRALCKSEKLSGHVRSDEVKDRIMERTTSWF